MWQSLSEHIEVLGAILLGLISLVLWGGKRQVMDFEERLKEMEDRLVLLEGDAPKHHEELMAALGTTKLEIIEQIRAVELKLAERYVTKEEYYRDKG